MKLQWLINSAEESGNQTFKNVNWTHPLLASGKLVLQGKTTKCTFTQETEIFKIKK